MISIKTSLFICFCFCFCFLFLIILLSFLFNFIYILLIIVFYSICVIVPILSCLFVVGFCIITILKINGAISAVDQTTNDLITTLRDGLMLILAFYYGTSSGSQNKDVMLYNSTPTDNQK